MATKLSSVTCHGLITYLDRSGAWDHNGDIHIWDEKQLINGVETLVQYVEATEVTPSATKAQRGYWASGSEDGNTVTVVGDLYVMDSVDVQGQGKKITVVIERPTGQYPAGRGGYSLNENKPDLMPFCDAPGQGSDDMVTEPA